MGAQILAQESAHALALPEEEDVDEDDLEDALQVRRQQSQASHHAEENGEEDGENHAQIHGEESEGQEVVDRHAEGDADGAEKHVRHQVLRRVVRERNQNPRLLRALSVQRVRKILR